MKQNRRKHRPSFKSRVAIRQAQAEALETLKGEETTSRTSQSVCSHHRLVQPICALLEAWERAVQR